MKTLILITMCAVALSWSDRVHGKKFSIRNKTSKENNRYVNELADTLSKELQDKPFLKLNQTVIEAIKENMFVAIVVGEKKPKIVKVYEIKPENKNTDDESSDESTSSDSEEE